MVEIAVEKGLIIYYHGHAHEVERRYGKCYLDILLEEITEMAFEADTCWIRQDGEDVIGYMQKYAARIPLLHGKDVTAEGEITELGIGVIDFKAVAEFCSKQ